MKNIILGILKFVGGLALVAVIGWGIAYGVSPDVRTWTNENVFQIEAVQEDEPTDEENNNPEGDVTDNENTENGEDVYPKPAPDPEIETPEEE